MSDIRNYIKPSIDWWQSHKNSIFKQHLFQFVNCVDIDALNPASLENISLVGFCCDEGIRRNKGRVGASLGPAAVRSQLANMTCAVENDYFLSDCGNIECIDKDLEGSQKSLSQVISKIVPLSLPIVFGGGHETSWGVFQGLSTAFNCSDIGIINFDAHFDLRSLIDGEKGTSGTPFRQMASYCRDHNYDFNYLCIGVQPYANTKDLFEAASCYGVRYILAEEVYFQGFTLLKEKLRNFIKEHKYIYLSLCLDVFSQNYAPGVSAPQILGLSPWQLIPFFDEILASKKLIACDVVELSPPFDKDAATANLAAQLSFRIMCHYNKLFC